MQLLYPQLHIPIQEKDNSLLDKRIIDLEKKQYFISNEIPEYLKKF